MAFAFLPLPRKPHLKLELSLSAPSGGCLLLGRQRWRGRRPLHGQGVEAPFFHRGLARSGEGDRLTGLVGQLSRR